MRGIQDNRQIVDGKTNDKENNDEKGGFRYLNIRQHLLYKPKALFQGYVFKSSISEKCPNFTPKKFWELGSQVPYFLHV